MKKFLKAWRKARVYNNNFGGSFVFWEICSKTWMAVPNPIKPDYNEMYQLTNPENFYNYIIKRKK